jgi:predicted ester cyclase
MNTDKNKALYQRFIQEVFNEGKLDNLDQFLAPAYIVHDPPPTARNGAEAVKQIVTAFRTAFPDLSITIDELVAEGDIVCARATSRGTHNGPLFGIAPTGKSITMTGLTMVTIIDGRLTESWVRNDITGLMNQIAPKK